MTRGSETWKQDLTRWINEAALPLWTRIGVDHRTGTVWEALDHHGQPLSDMQRRLRVQARQAYCFSKSDVAEHQDLALQLFRFVMDQGFDPETGYMAAYLDADTRILTAPHDLYDMSFVFLAASGLIDAGFDMSKDLARLEAALAQLKAPRGWYENAARSLPRRQNPHMHMFEAFTALFTSTGAPRFRDMAEECLGLFRDVFLARDGRVLEYFDTDMQPLEDCDQVIEPGHMAEWVYLLDRYEAATGRDCGVDLAHLFTAVLQRQDGTGLLPDRYEPKMSDSRRLWPQTELFKAVLALKQRGLALPDDIQPDDVLERIWRTYFAVPVHGGWYDQFSRDGTLLSQNMPASTFYHILIAFRFYISDGKAV